MALNHVYIFCGLNEVSSREYTLKIYVRGEIESSEEKNEMSEVDWSNTTEC